jgi:hypothetical protein
LKTTNRAAVLWIETDSIPLIGPTWAEMAVLPALVARRMVVLAATVVPSAVATKEAMATPATGVRAASATVALEEAYSTWAQLRSRASL